MKSLARSHVAFSAVFALLLSTQILEARPAAAASISWASGSSGFGVATGLVGTWRDRPVDIAGTWADDESNSANFWSLQKGGEYGNWNKPVDVAVGAFDAGGSWSRAAAGAYDDRWSRSLAKLKALRSSSGSNTYVRFAHEMNGNWYPWQANAANASDFRAAWKRYRALQLKIFPSAKLVFNVNRESIGTSLDWRKLFPGKGYVDALGVDYYNNWPYVGTASQWDKSLEDTDVWGAPKGLAKHLAFANSQGLSLTINEWSGNASFGDSPAFVTGLLSYVRAHAGWNAGQIRYEILFNSQSYDGRFALFGSVQRMPKSSSAYAAFFRAGS